MCNVSLFQKAFTNSIYIQNKVKKILLFHDQQSHKAVGSQWSIRWWFKTCSPFQCYIAAFLLCATEENNAMTFTVPLSVTPLPLGENMQSDAKWIFPCCSDSPAGKSGQVWHLHCRHNALVSKKKKSNVTFTDLDALIIDYHILKTIYQCLSTIAVAINFPLS